MQKVFKDCYDLDKNCYESYGLTEDILMEHAARVWLNHIRQNTIIDKDSTTYYTHSCRQWAIMVQMVLSC